MHFMILRRSDRDHEAARPTSPAVAAALTAYSKAMDDAGILRACAVLQPSASGARLHLSATAPARVVDGPFTETKELIAGFAIIDVPDRESALDWAGRWPEDGVELEVRETGCPGGCAKVAAQEVDGAPAARFVIMLRSSAALEAEAAVPQARLDALDAHNAAAASAGVLLSAEGLRSSQRGARLKLGSGKVAVMDGPFTEIKEMIAGYWLIRAASLADALAWAERLPYPSGSDVELEVRQLYDAPATDDVGGAADFGPAQRAAEQHMRSEQLDAAMRAQLAQVR